MASIATDWQIWKRQAVLGAWNRRLLYNGRLDDFYKTEYFNDYIVPNRAYDAVGLAAPLGDDGRFHSVAQVLFHHDGPRGPTFGARGLELLRLTLPAYRAGVDLRQRLGKARQRLGATLDALGEPLRLHDLNSQLLHQTPAFTRLLRDDPEGELLSAEAHLAARALVKVDGGGSVTGVGRPGPVAVINTHRGIYRTVGCLLSDELTGKPAVLVSMSRIARPLPTRDEVARRFGLTPRRAEVALLLAEGRSDKAVASELRISVHTARRHVEAVLRGMGVHSRREVGRAVAGTTGS